MLFFVELLAHTRRALEALFINKKRYELYLPTADPIP